MEIEKDITFKQLVNRLEELRHEYDRFLCLFFDIKDRIKYRKETRDLFYSLNIEYWQKERIWDYMNYYEEIDVLKNIANKYK